MCNVKVFVFIAYITTCYCRRPYAGPYNMDVKAFYKCSGTEKGALEFGTTFEKLNKTHISYSSNVTLKYGIRDTSQMILDMSVYQNKGWKDNFMQIQLNKLCSDLIKGLPGVMETLYAATGNIFHGCPVPAGKYEVKKAILLLHFGVKVFPYNKYKITFKIKELGKVLACAVMVVDIVPDKGE